MREITGLAAKIQIFMLKKVMNVNLKNICLMIFFKKLIKKNLVVNGELK